MSTPARPRSRAARIPRLARVLLAVLVGTTMLSGCDFDVYKLPLPGGADTGDDPITVTVQFADVLDLVPKSSVKVNDVNVGRVTDVRLDGWKAEVDVQLRRDVDLPDNAIATIRQTSLLGEKFVSLGPPDSGAGTGRLGDGDVIGLDRTGRNPEIEEVLGALSLVLNGGGVAQLRTIARELNAALGGREDAARSVLTQVDTLTTNLDQNKEDIVAAIEALNRLSIAANRQIPTIDSALAELPRALRSIDSQRADLVRTLQALDDLSAVGVSVISQSKDSTIEAIKQLQPVLTQLADSGSAFVDAFNTFYAYPFVDEAVGRDPQVARNLQLGDYVNLDIKLDLDLSPILPTTLPTNLPLDLLNAVQQCLASFDPLGEACRSLIGNGLLKEQCSRPPLKGTLICTLPDLVQAPPGIPTVSLTPVIPVVPGLGGVRGDGSTGDGSGGGGDPGGGAGGTTGGDGLLGGLTGGLGLNRAGTPYAPPNAQGTGGPTIAQMGAVFDPDLVALMMPGMMAAPRATEDAS